MTTCFLEAFKPSRASAPFQILVTVLPRDDRLRLVYRLTGPLEQIVIPEPGPSVFQDELWTQTCFEIFIKPSGYKHYEEWNFSLSSAWAHYSFSSYRQRIDQAARQGPLEPIYIERSPDRCELSADVPRPLGELEIGLATVLLTKDGKKTYWALNHHSQKPDFHDARSFTAKLRT
jgi:hypothetical protein